MMYKLYSMTHPLLLWLRASAKHYSEVRSFEQDQHSELGCEEAGSEVERKDKI